MQTGIIKKEILIAFIIFTTMTLAFPLLSEATEIEKTTQGAIELEVAYEIEDFEEWEIVIIDEPIPGATPSFPQIEIIDSAEEILLIAILPKTGQLNSIVQSGLGAIMVCLGVYISRKGK